MNGIGSGSDCIALARFGLELELEWNGMCSSVGMRDKG